jgi:NADH dehydrogenase FAD-containing subunit
MASKVNIVIVGASFAGILSAHAILRDIPTAKVTLINPSRKFFYNIAAPRILAKPYTIKPNDYLLEIAPLFVLYSSELFVFMEGKVISIDLVNRSVMLHGGQIVPYDYLIIASGSTTSSTLEQDSGLAPWKVPANGKTADLIQTSQQYIASARSIVIGGAGPVGVEFAGELAETLAEDGEKRTITLVSGTNRLFQNLKDAVGYHAESILKSKGVTVLKGSRVTNAVKNSKTSKWTVLLENGEEILADLYIATTGLLPANAFIPQEFLSPTGWVVVDENLRVKNNIAAQAKKQKDGALPIFALGDVTIHEPRIVRNIKEQVPVLVASLKADIDCNVQDPRPTYSPSQITSIMIPIGASGGTGLLFGIVPWGSIVWLIKGRNYLVPWVPGFLSGK